MSAVTGPLSGMVADRIGARLPSTVGLLQQALGLVWLVVRLADHALRLHRRGSRSGWARRRTVLLPNTSAAMNGAPRHRLGIASATLATLRQTGHGHELRVGPCRRGRSLPRDAMLQLFVGTNVTLGSQAMQAFVVGIRNAFIVSIVLCVIAAAVFVYTRQGKSRSGHVNRKVSPDVSREQKSTHRALAGRFLRLLGAMKRYIREQLPPATGDRMSEERFRTLLTLKCYGKGYLKTLAAHDGVSSSAR